MKARFKIYVSGMRFSQEKAYSFMLLTAPCRVICEHLWLAGRTFFYHRRLKKYES